MSFERDSRGRIVDPNIRGALPGGPPLWSDEASRRLRNERPHVDRSAAAAFLPIRARGMREGVFDDDQTALAAAFANLLESIEREVPSEFAYGDWRIVRLTLKPLKLFTAECCIVFENGSGERVDFRDAKFPSLFAVAKETFFRQSGKNEYTFVFMSQ